MSPDRAMSEKRDASDRLTFDFNNIPRALYSKVTNSIVSEFGLVPAGSKTNGLDEVFQDFKLDDRIVGLEWDNWSGYIVHANNVSSEELARKIAGYIGVRFDS